MDTTGQLGIEISPGISEAQEKTASLLHAIHLDWFGAAIASLAKGATWTITVNDKKREEPWAKVHFIECAPGTHQLELGKPRMARENRVAAMDRPRLSRSCSPWSDRA